MLHYIQLYKEEKHPVHYSCFLLSTFLVVVYISVVGAWPLFLCSIPSPRLPRLFSLAISQGHLPSNIILLYSSTGRQKDGYVRHKQGVLDCAARTLNFFSCICVYKAEFRARLKEMRHPASSP
ncbi:hypothetical protein BS78_05G080300 [Paspalum vaginatum]|nr:hypothetical protein BS78_05G080300 [Paspalum vaginatum]